MISETVCPGSRRASVGRDQLMVLSKRSNSSGVQLAGLIIAHRQEASRFCSTCTPRPQERHGGGAEVLSGLITGDPSSYLGAMPSWRPALKDPFEMPDLLRFAQALRAS